MNQIHRFQSFSSIYNRYAKTVCNQGCCWFFLRCHRKHTNTHTHPNVKHRDDLWKFLSIWFMFISNKMPCIWNVYMDPHIQTHQYICANKYLLLNLMRQAHFFLVLICVWTVNYTWLLLLSSLVSKFLSKSCIKM